MIQEEATSPAFQNTLSTAAKSSTLGWSMVVLFVALNIIGALLLKNEIQKLGNWNFTSVRTFFFFFLKLISSGKIIIAVVSLFGSTVAWSIALAHLELSRAYPVGIGLHFLAIMSASMFAYGESLTFFKVFGVFLILSGVASILK